MNEASGLTPPGVAWPASLSLSSSMDPSLKPRLRGVSHQFAFFVSVVLGAGLVASASGAGERAAAAVFGAAVAAMFGVSAPTTGSRGDRGPLSTSESSASPTKATGSLSRSSTITI
jgi:hypothetical protein